MRKMNHKGIEKSLFFIEFFSQAIESDSLDAVTSPSTNHTRRGSCQKTTNSDRSVFVIILFLA